MNNVFEEGDLRFNFSAAFHVDRHEVTAAKLSHCLKSVDFVVETDKTNYYVEVKDPDNPKAKKEQRDRFNKTIKTKTFRNELTKKYLDSFLFRYAQETLVEEKRHVYVVLLVFASLDKAGFLLLKDSLRSILPVDNHGVLKKKLLDDVVVVNLDEWKKYFSQFPVNRLSETLKN